MVQKLRVLFCFVLFLGGIALKKHLSTYQLCAKQGLFYNTEYSFPKNTILLSSHFQPDQPLGHGPQVKSQCWNSIAGNE